MIRICDDTGWLIQGLKNAILKIFEHCEVSAKSGMPKPSNKIFISHINQSIINNIQAYSAYIDIQGTKFSAIHFEDTGIVYSEAGVDSDRKGSILISALDNLYINSHGAPNYM